MQLMGDFYKKCFIFQHAFLKMSSVQGFYRIFEMKQWFNYKEKRVDFSTILFYLGYYLMGKKSYLSYFLP